MAVSYFPVMSCTVFLSMSHILFSSFLSHRQQLRLASSRSLLYPNYTLFIHMLGQLLIYSIHTIEDKASYFLRYIPTYTDTQTYIIYTYIHLIFSLSKAKIITHILEPIIIYFLKKFTGGDNVNIISADNLNVNVSTNRHQ